MLRNLPPLAAAAALLSPLPLTAHPVQIVADSGQVIPAYADIAGLILEAPLVIDATIRSTARITGAEAADVPPGYQRYYVTADIVALLRGDSALPAQIGYLYDAPLDVRGRPPALRKLRVILFARPVAGRPAQVQLVARDAQRRWSPEFETLARHIVADVLAPDAPPAITGIANAFYVPGTLPGEGQSQIFLTTATGEPVSLLIEHRPDSPPRWSVSFSDLVGQASPPPPRDSFAWFRLACALPAALSPESLSDDDGEAARILTTDYAMILRDLGPCTGKRD